MGRACWVVVLALLAACGESEQPPRASAPAVLKDCHAAGWKPLRNPGPPAATQGHGELGVVFANDSENDTCAWLDEAGALAKQGYAVAVFETLGANAYEADQALQVA